MTDATRPTLAAAQPARLRRPVLLVASITPMRDGGARIDEDAIGPLAVFQHEHGADGVFACGTTGEGLLLTPQERIAVASHFREAIDGPLIVNVGSQTTAQSCALAAQMAELGVDGVAAVAPPYYPLGQEALVDHMVAVARACDPLPFYMYVFTVRSGYPFPAAVASSVRDRATNTVGLKVSEGSIAEVAPFLATGLDVLVGQEPLIPEALRLGAIGTASGVASAFPAEVASVIDGTAADGSGMMESLRDRLQAGPGLIPALKAELGRRGLPVRPDVRAPLLAYS